MQQYLRIYLSEINADAQYNPLSLRKFKSSLTDLDGQFLGETFNYKTSLTANSYSNISMGANANVQSAAAVE